MAIIDNVWLSKWNQIQIENLNIIKSEMKITTKKNSINILISEIKLKILRNIRLGFVFHANGGKSSKYKKENFINIITL